MLCRVAILCVCGTLLGLLNTESLRAELPNPVLTSVYPVGIEAGGLAIVTVEGTALEEATELRSTAPGFAAERDPTSKPPVNRFLVTVPATTLPGLYDLRVVGKHGVSSPRTFVASRLAEQLEADPPAAAASTQLPAAPENSVPENTVALDSVVNGKIEKPGDVDRFRFTAKAGERLVVECWAARIDSQLRPVLELYDARGVRLAVNRGYHGTDALLDFIAPTAGNYEVRLFDLTFAGGAAHFYRLDFDTRPRVEFVLPCVVERGKPAKLTLHGRNLAAPSAAISQSPVSPAVPASLDVSTAAIVAPQFADPFVPVARTPSQFTADTFAYHHPAAHLPQLIGLTDLPVVENLSGHETRETALALQVPCEVSGLLDAEAGRHWYSLTAKRGEVFWLEAFAERLGSPLDLELAILPANADQELARFTNESTDLGGDGFSTSHSDPAGRWVAPADGVFHIFVRDIIVGSSPDPRRVYRLSVRREEPDFALAVVARRTDQPAGLNVPRGGREMLEVLVQRRRGLTGPIRVSAAGLPPGVECPDIWIGPEQDRAPLIFTAAGEAASYAGAIQVVGRHEQAGIKLERHATLGTMIWPNRPSPSGRIAQELPLAVAGDVPFTLTAAPVEGSVDQAGVLDVAITLETRGERPTTPFRIVPVDLPRGVTVDSIEIAPETGRGWLSFEFPELLPVGDYTFAVATEIEALVAPKPGAAPAKTKLTLVSNPITVAVKPARVLLALDPSSPTKIARGKIVQLKFTARRTGGFIGKVHVELAAPGGVVGVRARGNTLTGQEETASLQVIATDNAPLGRQRLLRLEAVGTVEDRPIYRAGKLIELEIVE